MTRPEERTCPECHGTGEYRYHPDETGEQCPYPGTSTATGWHDGWWWKQCWLCRGTGRER